MLLVLGGCGSSQKELGELTDDGRAAIHEWCPFLELESKHRGLANRIRAKVGDRILKFRCVGDPKRELSEQETGSITIDSKTNKLLSVNVYIRPQSYELIASRIVRPALDDEARRALDEVRPALERGSRKEWRRGGIYIIGEIDQVYESTWDFSVGYSE